MQGLCQYDAQGGTVREALAALAADSGADGATLDYARALCDHYFLSRTSIDAKISSALLDRALDRIDDVSRNVIRVAAVELARREIPSKVAVDEAIEIAREFGGADTPRFVNGVLDPILKQVEQGEIF